MVTSAVTTTTNNDKDNKDHRDNRGKHEPTTLALEGSADRTTACAVPGHERGSMEPTMVEDVNGFHYQYIPASYQVGQMRKKKKKAKESCLHCSFVCLECSGNSFETLQGWRTHATKVHRPQDGSKVDLPQQD